MANDPSEGKLLEGQQALTDTETVRSDEQSYDPLVVTSDTTVTNATLILVDSSQDAITVTLGSDLLESGKVVRVLDDAGQASSNTITVDTEGTETIEPGGASSKTITTDWAQLDLVGNDAAAHWRAVNRNVEQETTVTEGAGNGTGPQVDPALAFVDGPAHGYGTPKPPVDIVQADKRGENPLITPSTMGNSSDWVADPFCWVINGQVLIFLEDHESGGHGRVSLAVSDNGINNWTVHANIIDDGVHHSFTQAFPADGDWWMVLQSEAGSPNSIELWRSTVTPIPSSGWSKERTLVDAGNITEPWGDFIVDGCGFFVNDAFWLLAGVGPTDSYGHLGGWYIPGGDLVNGTLKRAGWAGIPTLPFSSANVSPQGFMPIGVRDPSLFYYQDKTVSSVGNGGSGERVRPAYLNSIGPARGDLSMSIPDEKVIPVSASGWDSDLIHHCDAVYMHPNDFPSLSEAIWRLYYDANDPASGESWKIGAVDIPAVI